MNAFLQGLLAQDSAPRRGAGTATVPHRRPPSRPACSIPTPTSSSPASPELHTQPGRPVPGRVDLVLDEPTGLIQFTPGEDLGRRLDHLPQTYLATAG